MRRTRTYRSQAGSGEISINMTPLIDCTFQLIIFFILTSQLASESLAKMELHRPLRSQAVPADKMQVARVIVNILIDEEATPTGLANGSSQVALYKVDGRPIGLSDSATLVGVLTRRKAAAGGGTFFVEIRADRRAQFGYVAPVMAAASAAGIEKMNLTALVEVGE